MNRPNLALVVLLSGLFAPLVAARLATGQPVLDGRMSCVRHSICPLLDDEYFNIPADDDFSIPGNRCEGPASGECHAATSVPAIPVVFVEMEREPESLVEYYLLYGGSDDLYCRSIDWIGEWRVRWDAARMAEFMASQYAQWQASREVAVSSNAVVADTTTSAATDPNADETTVVSLQVVRESTRHWVRTGLLGLARSMDESGRMLQNASRQLTQLVDNQTPPEPVSSPILD